MHTAQDHQDQPPFMPQVPPVAAVLDNVLEFHKGPLVAIKATLFLKAAAQNQQRSRVGKNQG